MTARPRNFTVGQMRDRITIADETTERDAPGQPIVTLVNRYVNEPAKYEDVSGIESTRGRQIEAGMNAIFTVRRRDGYRPRQVVIRRGQKYGIVHVRAVAGQDRYAELHCKAVIK